MPNIADERDIIAELGVRTLINAAGTYTVLTASLMRPEVVAAMAAASTRFVNIDELQEAAGRRVAALIGCEAAMITSGASAALTLGTAACITGTNQDFILRIPELSQQMKSEVIVQRLHRYGYDHAVRNCGVKMIEVDTAAELEAAINERTAMMLFFNDREHTGQIGAAEFVSLGKQHGIPTFNDAAADVPPTETLSKFTKMGFDLATFSGGKGIRGPQSAGLLLGRCDLIEAARLNSSPNSDSIGRGFKINKEEIIGMLVAVESYLNRDAEAEWREWEQRVETIAAAIADVESMQTETYIPPIANHVPHLKLMWRKDAVGLCAEDVRERMRNGEPSIVTTPASTAASLPLPPPPEGVEEMIIGVWMLQPGEDAIVARRLNYLFSSS
ncbi:MAG: selenocysteine synthase [Acidobacteriota bacterium]|nr:selenocysteine synthase [Acidobacteriota bacterium]